jgi:hypothetical protein
MMRIVLVCGDAAGFQSAIYNGCGARGYLYTQGIVFFRTELAPVEINDILGLGGLL